MINYSMTKMAGIYNGENGVSSIKMVLGKLDLYLTLYTKYSK